MMSSTGSKTLMLNTNVVVAHETKNQIYIISKFHIDIVHAAKNERPLTLLLQYADNWCGFVIEEHSKGYA